MTLVLVFGIKRVHPPLDTPHGNPPLSAGTTTALKETFQSVAAEAAGNPFADPAAENLENRSALKDAGGDASRTPVPL